MDITNLYQEMIVDHGRNPRNHRKMEGWTHEQQQFNPLCGDQVTLWLKIEDGVIVDASFEAIGCVISKASASMMTESIIGKPISYALDLCLRFDQALITGVMDEGMEDLNCLCGIFQHPSRFKCATLAWRALLSILDQLN